jgi:hypothetical protein
MTNDEMENSINFIVSQQAQTAVKLDRLTEKVDALAVAQIRAEERWTRTEESIRALLTIAEMHEREIQANTQQILSIGETTKATDERLNTLINVVERQISNGRNGKQ